MAASAVRTAPRLQTSGKVGRMPLATGRVLAPDDGGSTTMLNARMELVGRVAAGLAHDLNGPIGVMLGFTQLAREKLETGDTSATMGVVEYLRMIESAGENARGLARDMWDFARAAPGEIVEYDFTETLETSARLVAPSLRVAAIEPPAAGELRAQTVTGDRALWAQALVGVMIDAPTALPGGGSVAWNLDRGADGTSLDLELITAPNEPGATATTPLPAQEWECRESTRALIHSLGGALRPLSELEGGRRGIEMTVPRASYRD